MIPLTQKDLVIMSHLRKNSRESLTSLSKKTSIPISTIYDRMRAHEEGVITRHTVLIDFSKIGYNARAKIILKVDRGEREKLKEFMMRNPNINSVYKVNSGYDFMVEAVFKHIKDMEDFVDNLEQKFNIEEKTVLYVIEDIKKEAFLSDPQLIELV